MTPGREPRTRLSGRLSGAVAAAAAIALGVGVGEPMVVAGVAGALVFAWGVVALAAESYARQAAGSVAVVAGGLAMLVTAATSTGGASGLTVPLGVVGLAVLAVGATGGTSTERFVPVKHALGVSLIALLGAFALAFVGATVVWLLVGGSSPGSVLSFVGTVVDVALATPLSALFALQILALALIPLLDAARAVVDRWFRGDVPVRSWDLVESLQLSYDPIPFAYWASLPFQGLFAMLPWGNATAEWLLSSLWLFGTALEVLLTSGILLGLLVLAASLPLAVLAAEYVRRVADAVLRPVPARTAALGAGGILAAILAPAGVTAATVLDPDSLPIGNDVPPSVLVLGGLMVAVGALYVLVTATVATVQSTWRRRPDVVAGSGLLFLATVAGAAADAPPPVVFVGVAATLVAWDLGSTAADLGNHVGLDAETRRAEVVHAVGTLGVGAVGVALAVAAVYLLGPLAAPAEQAGAATLLALGGLLALAATLALDAVE